MTQKATPTQGKVLALVRHGEYSQPKNVPSAHLPYPLTGEGRKHAKTGAQLLHQFAEEQQLAVNSKIYCSRMLRAWQTADLFARHLHDLTGLQFTVVESDELAERSLGALANLKVATIEQIISDDPRYDTPPRGWKRSPDYKVPYQGAESLLQAGARVARMLQAEAEKEKDKRILTVFVGHGGAFRHAAHHLGILKREDLAKLSMHHGKPVFVSSASDKKPNQFTQVGGEWKVRTTSSPFD